MPDQVIIIDIRDVERENYLLKQELKAADAYIYYLENRNDDLLDKNYDLRRFSRTAW